MPTTWSVTGSKLDGADAFGSSNLAIAMCIVLPTVTCRSRACCVVASTSSTRERSGNRPRNDGSSAMRSKSWNHEPSAFAARNASSWSGGRLPFIEPNAKNVAVVASRTCGMRRKRARSIGSGPNDDDVGSSSRSATLPRAYRRVAAVSLRRAPAAAASTAPPPTPTSNATATTPTQRRRTIAAAHNRTALTNSPRADRPPRSTPRRQAPAPTTTPVCPDAPRGSRVPGRPRRSCYHPPPAVTPALQVWLWVRSASWSNG